MGYGWKTHQHPVFMFPGPTTGRRERSQLADASQQAQTHLRSDWGQGTGGKAKSKRQERSLPQLRRAGSTTDGFDAPLRSGQFHPLVVRRRHGDKLLLSVWNLLSRIMMLNHEQHTETHMQHGVGLYRFGYQKVFCMS